MLKKSLTRLKSFVILYRRKNMKVAIVYVSVHHKNTEKVVKAMAEEINADLFNLNQSGNVDLSTYDVVGLASGAFFHNMHKKIIDFVKSDKLNSKQKVFLVCTCGSPFIDHTKEVAKILKEKNISYLSTFECAGFDTFGPFKIFGGIAKNRPNNKDLEKAKKFIKGVVK